MLEREFGYRPPIPEDLQHQYETDMDHVAGMFVVLADLNNYCPTLSSDIDIKTVQHMIYLHDGGEILVGDLTHGR